MTTFAPPVLAWSLHFHTTHQTIRVEIPAGEDYLIVIADHDPHPQDRDAILALLARVCPASPYALGIPEYHGRHDLWTAVYDLAALRRELAWL